MKNNFYWHWVGITGLVYVLGLTAGYTDGLSWWLVLAVGAVGIASRLAFVNAVQSAYVAGLESAVEALEE